MPKTVLLIDGDQYLYRACAATEIETRFGDHHVLASNPEEAWDTVQASLKNIFDHFGTKDHVLAFGKGENFRKKIDPSYKNNRANTRKPLCMPRVLGRLTRNYNVVAMDTLEADDVMGILATKPGPTDRIIVARDKDMKTIPGKLWDGSKFMRVSEADADYWHFYQTLIGDTSDGYKGCPGVGPVKAEKILQGEDAQPNPELKNFIWRRVVGAFEKAGLTADDALTQARLARILRWSDWDSKKKEPILWTPTTH